MSPSVLASVLTSKKTFGRVIKGVRERKTDISRVPWELQAPILFVTALVHSKGSVVCLKKDGDLFFPYYPFFSSIFVLQRVSTWAGRRKRRYKERDGAE